MKPLENRGVGKTLIFTTPRPLFSPSFSEILSFLKRWSEERDEEVEEEDWRPEKDENDIKGIPRRSF